MNDLNSILIEGNVIKKSELVKNNGTSVYCFSIVSNRYFKKDDFIEKEILEISIEASSRLAEYFYHIVNIGRNVRVVGHLKQSNDIIAIEAEHIESRQEHKINKQSELLFGGEYNA